MSGLLTLTNSIIMPTIIPGHMWADKHGSVLHSKRPRVSIAHANHQRLLALRTNQTGNFGSRILRGITKGGKQLLASSFFNIDTQQFEVIISSIQ